MRIRHRIPSIFNLSMVDVLCCALGCVILLWLVYQREARGTAEQNELSAGQLQVTAAERDEYKSQRDTARIENDNLKKQVVVATDTSTKRKDDLAQTMSQLNTVRAERDDLSSRLDTAKLEVANLKDQKAAADTRISKQETTSKELDAKVTAAIKQLASLENQARDMKATNTGLGAMVAAATQRVNLLESQIRDKNAQAGTLSKRAEELATKLTAAENRARKEEALASALEKEIARRMEELGASGKKLDEVQSREGTLRRDLDARDRELAAALSYRDFYAASQLRLRMAEKELGQIKNDLALAGRSIESLQSEKTTLSGEATRARAAAENRFAGIALTGKRVIFLVDMSGSMELVDENTVAPEKWHGVRDSLLKIMRSLPQLEKYQVVLFSEKVSFLLGKDNQWLDYNPQTTPDQVHNALAAITPRGGTNMYTAMEAAFRFRGSGLDTIYLFSDGIPNLGEGLPANAAKLSESEQSQILGKHILKTLKTNWNKEAAGRPQVRINAVGFFYESHDVGAFLWALARENDGSFVGMSKP